MLVFHKQKWNIDLDPNNAKMKSTRQSKAKSNWLFGRYWASRRWEPRLLLTISTFYWSIPFNTWAINSVY